MVIGVAQTPREVRILTLRRQGFSLAEIGATIQDGRANRRRRGPGLSAERVRQVLVEMAKRPGVVPLPPVEGVL